jgi:hypothetical protein
MALIALDCSTQVPDRVPTSPKCGTPIARRVVAAAVGATLTTIQETSKRPKAQILLSSLCFWVGLVWVIIALSAAQPHSPPSTTFPSLLVFVGIVWYVAMRFRIWWHHK